MEEAYVIGIRLVLEDAVSTGLAAIRGELATLDLAIAATTMHLLQLRAIAETAGGERRTTTEPLAEPDQGRGTDAILPSGRESHAGLQPVPAPGPQVAISAPPQSVPSLQTEVRTIVERERSILPASLMSPNEPSPAAAAPPITPTPSPNSPAPTGSARQSEPAHAPPGFGEPPAAPHIELTVPLSSAAAPPLAKASAADSPTEARRPASSISPVMDLPVAHLQPSFEAEHAAVPTQPATPAPASPTPAAYAPAAPPARPNQSASDDRSRGDPTSGSVFLDGHYVGRWLADHLAREASRPTDSATGFDPRLTPSFPGALQGY